ncbi:MAG: polysaccharide deacetylase family protein [Lachnospiraceae bacterium]|nr:polysaccharide deacetylase family protein [Lachnospiraceae bacterium]
MGKRAEKGIIFLELLLLIVLLFWQDSVQVFCKNLIWPEKKKIALTFDDGPTPGITDRLLDGLKERNIKASFFVLGKGAEEYPELIKREYEEGHLIGNHTYHHVQLTAANHECFQEEILMTNEVLEKITGEETMFIRPPFGSWHKKYEKELAMIPVFWTIDPLDWNCSDIDCIVKNVVTKTEENDIILMHDGYETSVTAALRIIDELQKQDYEFVTVDELLLE